MKSDGGAAVGAAFQPAKGGTAGEIVAAFERRLSGQVCAQRVMVVEVLVTQSQPIDALAQEVDLWVGNEQRITRIGEPAVQGGDQTQAPVGLAQEQDAGIAGDLAAGEAGLDFTAIKAWKRDKVWRTMWPERSPVGLLK